MYTKTYFNELFYKSTNQWASSYAVYLIILLTPMTSSDVSSTIWLVLLISWKLFATGVAMATQEEDEKHTSFG